VVETKYLILGGGMVAGYAAKELASQGLKPGELAIVSADAVVPYERPPLSKGFLSGKDDEAGILINGPDWYREHGIEVRLNTGIEHVDLDKKRLRSSSGEEFECEHLLLATGARARKLDCPGSDLGNVFYLRSLKDSETIRSTSASAETAVIIGGGFIGMEVASVLAQKNIQTTLVIREDRIWSRFFTPAMSAFFEQYYAGRGVRIVKQARVTALEGKGKVQAVLLDTEQISCDFVVAGVGAVPVTELLEKTVIAVDNGIVVNEYLEASLAGIYAAGDVANYPDKIFGRRRRVEHWDNAVSQGQHWARIVLGERQAFTHVPYFFSDVFDLSYELWGDSAGATGTVIRGDTNSPSFSMWWL
jgi:NADPH-dependent 2,4-dienoyl-CoA reductase/sulfur reductase-like enzyme